MVEYGRTHINMMLISLFRWLGETNFPLFGGAQVLGYFCAGSKACELSGVH